MEYIFLPIVLIIIITVLAKLNKLEGRIRKMQYTIDQLAQQTVLPENPINEELRKLIIDGEEVKAVKRVRETLGLSLIEGKEYIDKLKLSNR